MPTEADVPSKLRLDRIRKGRKLWQMAAAIGHSIGLLSMIERGHLNRPDVVKKMRAYLDDQKKTQ